MTFSLRPVALAAALATGMAAATAPAQAEDTRPGWYASLAGAYVVTRDSNLSTISGELTWNTTAELKGGFGFTAAVGYGSTPGFRGEVEFGWRNAGLSKLKAGNVQGTFGGIPIDVSAPGSLSVNGNIDTMSLMANGIYGFEVWKLRPYVGAGLGMARHKVTFDSQNFMIGGAEYTFPKVSEDDYVIAWQAMAGIEHPFSETMTLRTGYRYFGTSRADLKGIKASYGSHNFEAGVLFRF